MRPATHKALVRLTVAMALVTSACTGQDTVPLDLDGTVGVGETPTTTDDTNAAARAEGQRLAEKQCLDDAELDRGVVQIAQPETGVVVAEIIVDCSEVRERPAD